jgi:putative N6-adenine-specific DNA methylase
MSTLQMERKENYEMIAKTFFGLEDVLAKELKGIGAKNIIKHNRAVSFIGNIETMYKANYHLRTAL